MADNSTFLVTGDALREAMRFWSTGVTVVAASHAGERHGMTVSSFTSLSLEPPLVLVSLSKDARTHRLVLASQAFGVTVLSSGQEEISKRFAGNEDEPASRFAGVKTFTLESGSPLLSGGLAVFDCRLAAEHDAGTHSVFIGEVLAASPLAGAGRNPPLLYFNQGYRKLAGL